MLSRKGAASFSAVNLEDFGENGSQLHHLAVHRFACFGEHWCDRHQLLVAFLLTQIPHVWLFSSCAADGCNKPSSLIDHQFLLQHSAFLAARDSELLAVVFTRLYLTFG